jgi:hypothetical protein
MRIEVPFYIEYGANLEKIDSSDSNAYNVDIFFLRTKPWQH